MDNIHGMGEEAMDMRGMNDRDYDWDRARGWEHSNPGIVMQWYVCDSWKS